MAGRFTESELTIIRNAITANPNAKQRTLAKDLVSSGVLPGRTFYTIYSRVRKLTPKPAVTAAPTTL